MQRFEIITGIGTHSIATASDVVRRLAAEEADGFGVTITPGEGYCAPWGGEPVLTIVHYGASARDALAFAENVADRFEQESVGFGATSAAFTFAASLLGNEDRLRADRAHE